MEDAQVQAGTAAGAVKPEPAPVPEQRAALVTKMTKEVAADKKHWDKRFKRMREDIKFVRAGGIWADGETDRYVVNITLRHLKNLVANLYAKNPRAVAKRKDRLEFQLWDGKQESLQMAVMAAQNAFAMGAPLDPDTYALLQDVVLAGQRMKMLERLGRSLEICFHHYLDESNPRFKLQAKSLVRRVGTTGVGYVKIGFQRQLGKTPDLESRLLDITQRLATIERITRNIAEGESDPNSAEAEELRLTRAGIEADMEVIVREGLTFAFPRSTSIIPDRRCYQLQGFLGAGRVTQEYMLTPEEIQEVYGVDVRGAQFRAYTAKPDGTHQGGTEARVVAADEECLGAVWQTYDRRSGLVYTILDGYQDFLEEPAPPKVTLERFFPFYVLTFNEVEDEDDVFPDSDVRLLRSMQIELNRSRDALTDHRKAAAPFTISTAGTLTDDDKVKIQNRVPHEIVDLKGMPPGTEAGKVLQQAPVNPIDPNLYQTGHIMEDALHATGSSEAAAMGTTGGDSATENSIAEASRTRSVSSDIDAIDDMLTDIARDASHVMLMNLNEATVKEIAGPGAVWPTMSRAEIARDLYLSIKAGSSGKPNKAQDLANLERVAPFLLQLPGIAPMWLAELMVKAIDEGIDLKEAIIEGMPSIQAMNTAMKNMQPPGAPGDPASPGGGAGGPGEEPLSNQPADQGAQGGNNAQQPPGTPGGAQPAYPPGGGQFSLA